MKRVFYFILLLFAALNAVTASAQEAVTFTINFDDATAVEVLKNYSEPVEVVTGDNAITLELYDVLMVSAADGYAILSITDAAGEPETVSENMWYVANYGAAGGLQGKVFTVRTLNLEATRTASFTMTVDDPTKVVAQFGGTSANVELERGTKTYKFNPEVESTLYLSSNTERNLYAVRVNGESVEVESYSVEVTLTDGCTVEVEANYPNIPVTITIEYDSVACPGLITGYAINYEDKGALVGNTITARTGDDVRLVISDQYCLDDVTINDVPYDLTYFWESISLTPSKDTRVAIVAHAYSTLSGVVNIDRPEAVALYAGYRQESNIVALQAGRNEVTVQENAAVLSWVVKPGYRIVSVSDATGRVITNQSVDVAAGFELTFVTAEVELDKSFVLYVSDKSSANYYFNVANSERNAVDAVDGYNVVRFTDSYNPYEIGWAGESTMGGCVYVNGELLSPLYTDGTYWKYIAADGDVVKVFVKGAPEICSVAFEAVGEPEVTVVRNLVTEVADWQSGFSDFPGTLVSIKAADGKAVSVAVDGTEVAADAGGVCTFSVERSCTVTVTNLAGVADIVADDDADADVYNLQGVKVGTRKSLSTLPAGLYITAGRKVVVK